MIVDEDIYDFLEHFGVKGMHWGVRSSKSESSKQSPKIEKTPEEKAKTRKKMLIAGGVAAGAIAAGILIASNRRTPISKVDRAESSKHLKTINSFLKANKDVKMRDVGKSSPARNIKSNVKLHKLKSDHQNWLREFSAKQTTINRAANVELKEWDNKLNVPIYMRTYLSDFD